MASAHRLALLDDPGIGDHQEWRDHYGLEYYIHDMLMTLGYRTSELPRSKTYRRSGGRIRRSCLSVTCGASSA